MGEISLRKALDDYKTVYMAYRSFAERTREEYLNDLQDFIDFVEKAGINKVGEVGLPNVERYIASLEQKGFASLTRKRKLVTIRSFLTFLYLDGYVGTNIAKKVVLPFTETRTPQILTKTECNQLRLTCAGNPRDRAIVELLLQTGIKLSELTRLIIDDVDFERLDEKVYGYIRIVGGRSKKERLIPLNDKAYQAIKSYLGVRNDTENKTLFLNRFDKSMGERGVQKMLRKYLKAAGIGKANVSTLRHTFGTHHISKGTDLKTVQEVMGLKDARSTSIYQTLAKEVIARELQENAL